MWRQQRDRERRKHGGRPVKRNSRQRHIAFVELLVLETFVAQHFVAVGFSFD